MEVVDEDVEEEKENVKAPAKKGRGKKKAKPEPPKHRKTLKVKTEEGAAIIKPGDAKAEDFYALKGDKQDPSKRTKIEEEDPGEEQTSVEKELQCQICLNTFDKPVMLPCQSHSICSECLSLLSKKESKASDGRGNVHCPTCGPASGSMKIKHVKSSMINRELERIKVAYKKEKKEWQNEKEKLKMEAGNLKFYMTEKEAKEAEKDEAIEKLIRDFETPQLKNLFSTMAGILSKRGEDIKIIVEELPVNGKRKASQDSTDLSTEENLYPFHPNLKKVKTK